MEMPEKIISERLVLERPYPATFKLAEEIFANVEASRATLRVWLPWVDKTSRAEDTFTSYLATYCLDNWENKTGFPYMIRSKETNELLGSVDLMSIDEKNKSGEIGYYLFDTAVGFGYMQEAVKSLEKAGFEAGLNRIIIRNDTNNARSVNVAKNCGYHLDGVMRQDKWSDIFQKFVDSNVFSKLKSDIK